MDLLGLGALALVGAEWLALGWLSGTRWPQPAPWGPRWGLRLLVGGSLVGLSMLLLAVVGVSFAWPPLVLASAAIAALLIRWISHMECDPLPSAYAGGVTRTVTHSVTTHEKASFGHHKTGERLGWGLVTLVLGAAALRSLLVPEAGWDAYSHWGLKAQAFLQTGAIVDTHTAHEYYPPLVPLLQTWLYLHRGVALIDLGKAVWALVGSAFVLCLAWHLRLALAPGRSWAAPALALAVVLGTPQLLEGFWTGEADLALTAYLTLLVLALLRWLAQPRRAWLIQAMVFGAAAGLTKYEGLFRVGVVLAAFSLEALLRRRPGQLVGTLCVGVAAGLAYLPWAIFRATHGIEVSGEHLSHLQLGALGAVLVALIAALGGLRTGGGIVVAVLSWAIARQQLLRPLILVTLGQLAATLLAFLVTDYSPVLQVQLSATRLFEQFLPVALFASGVWLTENL